MSLLIITPVSPPTSTINDVLLTPNCASVVVVNCGVREGGFGVDGILGGVMMLVEVAVGVLYL